MVSDPPAAGRRSVWVLACVLIAVGVAAFASSFQGVFMGDDLDTLVGNRNLRSLWPLSVATSAPPDSTLAGRPVAAFTFTLNYLVASEATVDVVPSVPNAGPVNSTFVSPWGYHAVNLAIHLCAGLALFGVVRRTLTMPVLRDRFGGASSPLAFAIALVWIVHPLQTAAVTYLVQRVESLMGCLLLTTLYCAIRASASDFKDRRWVAAAVAACAVGMGVKEVMFAAPVLVAVWIYLFRPDIRLIDSPRVLLTGLASAWIVLAVLLMHDSRPQSVGIGAGWTSVMYLRTQAAVLVHYLGLVFWPHPLTFSASWQPVDSWTSVLPQALLLASLGIATVVGFIRRSPASFLGVWFFLILAPTSSFLPIVTEVAADHRMYLPLAAIVTAVVLGAYAGANRVAGSAAAAAQGRNRWSPVGWTAVAAITLALAGTTVSRNRVYASADLMTQDDARVRPDDVAVQVVYGSQLSRNGQHVEAERVLRRAMELALPPGANQKRLQGMLHFALGSALCAQRKFVDGIAHLEQAIALNPELIDAYGFLGEALLSEGRARDAMAYFERGLAKDSDRVPQLARTAWVLATSSDASVRNGKRAVQNAEKALALAPPSAVGLDILAAAYAEDGQYDRAVATVRQAIDLDTRQGGSALTPTLSTHLALFQVGRPVRTINW